MNLLQLLLIGAFFLFFSFLKTKNKKKVNFAQCTENVQMKRAAEVEKHFSPEILHFLKSAANI